MSAILKTFNEERNRARVEKILQDNKFMMKWKTSLREKVGDNVNKMFKRKRTPSRERSNEDSGDF